MKNYKSIVIIEHCTAGETSSATAKKRTNFFVRSVLMKGKKMLKNDDRMGADRSRMERAYAALSFNTFAPAPLGDFFVNFLAVSSGKEYAMILFTTELN